MPSFLFVCAFISHSPICTAHKEEEKKPTVNFKSNELSVDTGRRLCLIHSGYIKCAKCNAGKVCTTKDGIHLVGITNALGTTKATATMTNSSMGWDAKRNERQTY